MMASIPLPLSAIRALALGVLLAGLVAARPGWPQIPQRIVAVVNDEVVSLQDLNNRLELVLFTSGVEDSAEARQRLAPQVLRELIEETLQMQEARRLNITVGQQEIEQALSSIAERNGMQVDEMRRLLTDGGVALNTLLDQIRAQIAWLRIVNQQVRPEVNVTVDQLDLAVQEARLNERQPEFLLSEIVLPVDNPAQEDAVAGDARRLIQTVQDGGSFEALARQVSAAASASRGGDLGWVRGALIPPELFDALDQLQPGELSPPVRSSVGYHVFWLRDRRLAPPEAATGDAAVEVELTQILFPYDGTDNRNPAALREQAAALRPRLLDCATMTEVAAELQAPASGALGWVRIGDLPTEFGRVLVDLPIGQVSAPLQGPAGIHLLMVCDRRGAVRAAPQRDQIEERLRREQFDRLARRYLRDLRQQAFVDVRL